MGEFRRSGYCATGSCVEVSFAKPTHSLNNGTCVEVGFASATHCAETSCVEVGHDVHCGTVLMRDSKNPGGPVLSFDTAAWSDFTDAIKTGAFHG